MFLHPELPLEIRSRGRLAVEAYNKALTEGKAYVKRVPIMLIGQDHSGKTSLKKSLIGKPFNPNEDSTVRIDVDPSYIKVSTEIWKVGDNTEGSELTGAIEATSFEQQAARLVADDLKEEQSGFVVEKITMKNLDLQMCPSLMTQISCLLKSWVFQKSLLKSSLIPL